MNKAIAILSTGILLTGCSHTSMAQYTVSDGRKVEVWTVSTLDMVSRDTWAESEPGSGVLVPVSHTAVGGVAQSIGPAVVGIAGATLLPGGATAGSVVNVIATGGTGGDASAVSK